MQSESEGTPLTEPSWVRFVVALAIGFGGTAAELFLENVNLLMAPAICAAAIGMTLPIRQYVSLIVLLCFAIFLPAVIEPQNAGWLQRVIGLTCLGAVLFAGLRSNGRIVAQGPSIHREDSDDHREDSDDHREDSDDLQEEPSTLIHPQKNDGDDSLAKTSSDLGDRSLSVNDDTFRALERLRSAGSFDEKQLRLIKGEMRKLSDRGMATDEIADFQSGDRVGHFVIDGPLGRGGVGNVYRGHDVESGEPAAIKILHNVRVSERFRREMHMVQQLAHPNIVTAYEVGEFHGLPFITMELLQGPDLNVRVRDDGPIQWLISARYVLQTARALEHAHRRNLIHRDIKPGNIILNGDDVVKLVDLGLAAMATGEPDEDKNLGHDTKEGHLAGTLPFMAPEQAKSLSEACVQSDIYSLGATWYYLLTGRPRLRGETFSKQFENLLVKRRFNALPDKCMPDSLLKIYQRMTAYDKRRRYENCGELAAELEEALATAGESVTPGDINVLVVEDSHTDMLLTIEMLRRTNQSLVIRQAKNLAEGIDIYNSLPIDLVLLDLTLPDSSGVQTVERFRSVAPHVPIVVLTGLSEEEIAAECIEAGATNFVSKTGLNAHKMERAIFVTLSRHGVARPA